MAAGIKRRWVPNLTCCFHFILHSASCCRGRCTVGRKLFFFVPHEMLSVLRPLPNIEIQMNCMGWIRNKHRRFVDLVDVDGVHDSAHIFRKTGRKIIRACEQGDRCAIVVAAGHSCRADFLRLFVNDVMRQRQPKHASPPPRTYLSSAHSSSQQSIETPPAVLDRIHTTHLDVAWIGQLQAPRILTLYENPHVVHNVERMERRLCFAELSPLFAKDVTRGCSTKIAELHVRACLPCSQQLSA